MVVETPGHVAAIAAQINVSGARRKNERIDGQMRLDGAAMLLGIHSGNHLGWKEAKIQPWREPGYVDVFQIVELI